MRFLLDACVPRRLAESLRASGHDAIHLLEMGLGKLPDSEVFAKASAEKRIVLTFDLGFGEIIAASAAPSASVIVFRLQNTTVPRLIERLQVVLADTQRILELGVIVAVEETRHRVRTFPSEGDEDEE